MIFTHEWAVTEQPFKNIVRSIVYDKRPRINYVNRKNIESTIKWLYYNGYEFSFLE